MQPPAAWRGVRLVYALGATILALAAAHVLLDADPLVVEAAEVSILLVFAAATFLVGYRLARRGTAPAEARRVAVLVIGGGLGVGALAAAFVGSRLLSGEPTTEIWYMLSIGWSVGAAAGAWTGFYVVRFEAVLDGQRDLAKRLTVLQRVLRHNLRNEMTIVGGMVHDLRGLVDGERAESKLDVADRHVRNVTRLSERSGTLTGVWQSEGGSVVHLGDVLREAADEFREDHPAVPLVVDVPDDLRVRAHAQVGAAVAEALENAVSHNDDVEVWLGAEERADGGAEVAVADTGSGIPQSELQPLFSPAEGPLFHTTGLGLWLIYWIVEASGGELDVETGEDGTTLRMTFPAA